LQYSINEELVLRKQERLLWVNKLLYWSPHVPPSRPNFPPVGRVSLVEKHCSQLYKLRLKNHNVIFCVMTLCSSVVGGYQHFARTYFLYHQSKSKLSWFSSKHYLKIRFPQPKRHTSPLHISLFLCLGKNCCLWRGDQMKFT
jgi:hypothetical protein